MPANAGRYDFSGAFTGDQAYLTTIVEDMRSFLRLVKLGRDPRADLDSLKEIANPHFESATEISSVLGRTACSATSTSAAPGGSTRSATWRSSPCRRRSTTTSCTRCSPAASG